LVAPIPSALTLEEVPNIHRTLIMSWVWAIIFAIAAYLLVKAKLFKRYRVITVTIITVVLTVEVVYFWHAYTTLDYESNFIYRDDNKKLLANWLIQNGHNYDQIIIPNQNNLLLYYLFFKQDFSADYIGQFDLGWYIDHLDNIYPHDDVCGMAIDQKTMNATERIAVVSTEPCLVSLPLTATTIETINRKNLTHAYTIQAL
jgi:hypothetical protein